MIDRLSVFRGRDYHINNLITIRQPTIGEIEEYGEQKYFNIIKMMTASPADRKVEIWDCLHMYWDRVDEFEIFVSTFENLQSEDMSILIPCVDFTSFQPKVNPNTMECALVNRDGVKIDRAIFTIITDYLRSVHQLKKNGETGYDDFTKDCMIEDDRYDRQAAAKKPFCSVILPFASYLALNNGFHSVWDIPVGAFFYEMIRSRVVSNYENIMHGIYSGCVDIKQINNNELDYLGDYGVV